MRRRRGPGTRQPAGWRCPPAGGRGAGHRRPVPYYMHYGENAWAGVKAHLDTVTGRAAAPVIAKYTGVLAAADIEIFT